jgi:NAD(P)-dependent dehydrogenase (short-subunit alcohol dehydrogenase family)
VKSFAGQRALITGGSSGIGLALAQALALEGARVCIAARDPQRLAHALAELAALSPAQPPCSVIMDVTSPEAIARGVRSAQEALGGLDLLINNAGYAQLGYIDELDDQAYVDMMAVNYFGPMRLSRACLPYFVQQGGGRIVNVTSMLGFMGTFGCSAYCASKYALSGFTEALRQDALPFGVHVHLCYPPTTNTPGLERENRDKPPEAWAIEGKSRAFSAAQVAEAILEGVRRGRFQIVVGLDSWLIWFAQRLAPWLVRFVIDRVLMKELRRREPGRALRLPAV